MESQFSVLNGGRNEEPVPEQAGGAPLVYDFRRPKSVPKPQIRHLCTVFESFARALASKASLNLGCNLAARAVSVRQLLYGEFLDSLTQPTCAYALGLRPYPAGGILEISPELTFPLLEILLGAKAGSQAHAVREATEIERHVLGEIVQMILAELRESWKQFAQVAFSLESSNTNPHLLTGLLPAEPVIAFSVEIQVGEERGLINLALPALAIRMMQSKYEQEHAASEPGSESPSQEAAAEAIKRARVVVEVRMARASILIRDLLDLKAGQVIAFAQPVNRPLECAVNGQRAFKGEIVATANRVAFQVEGDLPPQD